MTAATGPRTRREATIGRNVSLPLAAGQTAWANCIACVDTTTATIKRGAAANANLLALGEFEESIDNSAGGSSVQVLVSLDKEVAVRWYDNATGGGAVTSANLLQDCYILDDHTVTSTASGNSKLGRVWALDTLKGVAVEKYTL